MPLAEATRNAILNAYARATSYSNPAVWVQIHTGDPGAAGTANIALNTTRQQAAFGSVASAGAISNSSPLSWPNVPAAETYTHVSFWTAATGGTFTGSDDLADPRAVQVGDTFTIAAGDIDLTV